MTPDPRATKSPVRQIPPHMNRFSISFPTSFLTNLTISSKSEVCWAARSKALFVKTVAATSSSCLISVSKALFPVKNEIRRCLWIWSISVEGQSVLRVSQCWGSVSAKHWRSSPVNVESIYRSILAILVSKRDDKIKLNIDK